MEGMVVMNKLKVWFLKLRKRIYNYFINKLLKRYKTFNDVAYLFEILSYYKIRDEEARIIGIKIIRGMNRLFTVLGYYSTGGYNDFGYKAFIEQEIKILNKHLNNLGELCNKKFIGGN